MAAFEGQPGLSAATISLENPNPHLTRLHKA